MNVIVICCDTLRYDYLGCNGNTWVRTPHIDRLAAQSVVFDNAWIGSYPTIPHRLECLTGQRGHPFQPWIPLPWEAVTLPQLLGRHGYVTMLVNTTPHLINHGFGYDRPFHAWHMIRGQEVDRYRTDPLHGYTFPCSLEKARGPFLMAQYYRNHIDRRSESDYGLPQVMGAAAKWLERNLEHERLFLWLDVFDVHEPWDPPHWYVDLYDPGYQGEEIVYPKRGPCDDYSEAEQQHIRALYAANITMFDRWLGTLLEAIEALGLAEDTALVFTSDHGQHMGDHRSFYCKSSYLYHEMARWVLMVRLPGEQGAGTRVCDALAQPVDLLPTVLEWAGIKPLSGAQGHSLRPSLRGQAARLRELAFSGSSLPWPNQRPISVTDGRWMFLHTGDRSNWELYDMRADLEQQQNLAQVHPDKVMQMHQSVLAYLRKQGTPEVCVRAFEEARPGGPRPELDDDIRAERARFPSVFVRENYTPFEYDASNVP
jgi:arylsulfatase A-like enzyme